MEKVQMEQAHPRTTSASRVRHPKLAMVSMLLGAFVGMFSETSLNIALPKLSIAFNMSTATLQWLVTGYMLIIGIIMPLSSIISKWFSTRKIIIFALLVFILGSVLSAMAPGFAINRAYDPRDRDRAYFAANVRRCDANLPTPKIRGRKRDHGIGNHVCSRHWANLNRVDLRDCKLALDLLVLHSPARDCLNFCGHGTGKRRSHQQAAC